MPWQCRLVQLAPPHQQAALCWPLKALSPLAGNACTVLARCALSGFTFLLYLALL